MFIKFLSGMSFADRVVDLSQPAEFPDHEAARFVVRGLARAVDPSPEAQVAIVAAAREYEAELQAAQPQPQPGPQPEAPAAEPQPEPQA